MTIDSVTYARSFQECAVFQEMARMQVAVSSRKNTTTKKNYMLSRYVELIETMETELSCSGVCRGHSNYVFSPRLQY